MNPKHLHILQHSLGCDEFGRGDHYRNRYVVGPDCDDFNLLLELVAQGLMRDHGPQQIASGMHCFSVSEKGIKEMRAASPKPPKLTPGRKRYLEFLNADSGMSFIEWLKASAKFERNGSAFR